ncbi:hypothetical protein FCL47_22435 [Desulfopila sp. IMCC35006]|uniref:hypothetical protein n=1 Tax=Desulfopila sp. IMCC35006 TaxID=2569542 RepID=UPI0010ACC820|nr:hypothetical protein [Desulfopila sp. IMCC35006]TKB23514.1 hypothetical protein FCL47_22435 [Desulfopila sp. IMCC35006]
MAEKKGPRTISEAMFEELIGDIDKVTDRLEKTSVVLGNMENKLLDTVDKLNEAGLNYRETIISFTEKAKNELSIYFDKNTSKTVDEQRSILQEVVKLAFEKEIQKKEKPLPERRATKHITTLIIINLLLTIMCVILGFERFWTN